MKPTYQELQAEILNLKKDLDYYKTLVFNNSENVIVFNRLGEVVFINAPILTVGYDPEEMKGKNLFDMLVPEDKVKLLTHFKNITPKIDYRDTLSYRIYHKDRSIRYFEGTITNKLDSPLEGIILNYSDVTDRIEAQKSLEAHKEILHTLINSTPDIICFKDGEGRWLEANDADLELFQLQGVDYKGKKDSELAQFSDFYYDAFMGCEDSDEITWKGKTLKRGLEIIPKPDGTQTILDVVKVPLFKNNGDRKGLVVLGRDITEMHQANEQLKKTKEMLQKQNNDFSSLNKKYILQNKELLFAKEKAEESNRLKTSFLANMSHEIRTPMNSILGFSKFLKEEKLNKNTRNEYIDHINESGNHLLGLINDIIDISKIDANQLNIVESDCSLNEFLIEIYQTFTLILKQKSNNLKINWIHSLKDGQDLIQIDSIRLRQILINLISNAVKFTNSGSIDVEYFINKENQIQFSIKDTGIGISKKDIPIIFERFRQADISSTREYGGSGLGLAISKSCVELLGGNLWVESNINEGSTFYFTVNYNPSERKNTKKESIRILNNKNLKGKSILIVDDDPFNSLILEKILSEFDVQILLAENGIEAIDKCKKNPQIDIVLMDIQMPILDGLKATQKILAFRPDLPIISQSANAMDEDTLKSKEAGCVDFITKPIDTDKLINKIYNQLFK